MFSLAGAAAGPVAGTAAGAVAGPVGSRGDRPEAGAAVGELAVGALAILELAGGELTGGLAGPMPAVGSISAIRRQLGGSVVPSENGKG